jgi:hypothetical protein
LSATAGSRSAAAPPDLAEAGHLLFVEQVGELGFGFLVELDDFRLGVLTLLGAHVAERSKNLLQLFTKFRLRGFGEFRDFPRFVLSNLELCQNGVVLKQGEKTRLPAAKTASSSTAATAAAFGGLRLDQGGKQGEGN